MKTADFIFAQIPPRGAQSRAGCGPARRGETSNLRRKPLRCGAMPAC